MATGLQKFGIALERENKTFSPGETIVGQVIVGLGKTQSVRGLKIRFKGIGETAVKCGKHNHYDREEYFRLQCYLLKGEDNETIEIVAGYHVFPFNFTLPHNIPNSFETKHGHIRYSIKAVIDRPWKSDHETSLPFMIKAHYDLSRDPASMVAINRDNFQSFCCFPFCWDTGSMTVNVKIPKSGYIVGEIIKLQILVDNNSTSVDVTRVMVLLKQKVTIYAGEEKREESKVAGRVVKRGPIDKKANLTVYMRVPDVPSSTFPHTKLFDVKYCLEIQIHSNGCCSDTQRSHPIVIGTMPVVNSQPTRNSSMIPSLPVFEPTAPWNPTIPFQEGESANTISIPDTTSTTEIRPPSYDDCMKNYTRVR